MIFNGHIPVTVGGVMRDFPATSDLQYRGFISLSGLSFGESEQGNWNQSNYSIYLQLRPDVDIQAFNKKISRDIINKYMIPAGKAAGQKNAAAAWKDARLYLQPLTRIHLHSYNIQQDDVSHGDIRFIYLFAAIALIILALACINFLNLSIARASRRAREVGIRKAIGSSRRKLIMQFLTESMLCSILSFLIGGIIARIMLPLFNHVTGVQLDIPWDKWWLFPLLCAATFVIGLLAGLYPAVYLSYFNPVKTLKGNLGRDRKNGSLKARLTIFQFAISIILLIGATVVYRQMQYVLHSNAGFDKDQVLVIKGTDALQSRTAAFRDELLRLPFVSDVSVSDFLPVTDSKRNGNTFHEKGKDEELITTQRWVVDENYIPTLDMKLLAGRNFSTGLLGDSATVIVNKAMADELGYENPIGKVITNGGETLTIIGEVNNFYYENLTQSVKPLIMVAGISNSMISVKLHTTEMSKALLSIRNTWKQFMPAQELRFVFMDDSYAAMYTQLGKVQYIFTAFAILGVVIACLGLFGLSAFMAEQKIKEISIRRVFGANARDLYLLMTSDFVKLILVAILIAVPVAWWCMQTWLEDYVYRIRLSWGIFAWSALAVLVVALFTVSGQALKAIRANPAKNLKIE